MKSTARKHLKMLPQWQITLEGKPLALFVNATFHESVTKEHAVDGLNCTNSGPDESRVLINFKAVDSLFKDTSDEKESMKDSW